MTPEGVKTAKGDAKVTKSHTKKHLGIGIDALMELAESGESVKHLRF
jgi:AMP nucleosidase